MGAIVAELEKVGAPEGRFLSSVWTAHGRPSEAEGSRDDDDA